MLNVHSDHEAYWGRGEEGKGGMEVGEEGDYIPITYTVTTRMTSASMRAILMFHNCKGQSHKTVSTDHNLSEEKGEPKRYQSSGAV